MAKTARLNEDQMYERVLAGDAGSNGNFFFGVTTTGIYCLPSCRARKPLRKNTRFFASAEAARASGLRACRKCRPDDFARGADPVLESIEALVAEMRANPAAFADVRAVARRSGFGPTRLFELFRLHYHATPADILLQARLQVARSRLLDSKAGLTAVAEAAGFESLSVFHDQFRRHTGLTPAAFRALKDSPENPFTLSLPTGYPLGTLRRALGRDFQSLTEKLENDVYVSGVQLAAGPARLTMTLDSEEGVRVEIAGPGAVGDAAVEAQVMVARMLGLDQDAAAFARLARKLGFARLVAGRPELRIIQTSTVFDGLLWAIIGQQINMPFAFLLRRRLTELAGQSLGEGLYAPPTPAAVAALTAEDLLPLQFSRQKAHYVIATSRLIANGNATENAEGKLDLEALRFASATRAERTLLAVHGLGPWSVNYLMMRSLGFADCVPYGDTGVTKGLQTLMHLEERPDIPATRRLMAAFAPWRSLATAHLWQLHQPEPT